MAGGNLFGRALSYFVNKVVVEGLANSPAFQRFAVRSSKKAEDVFLKAGKIKDKVVDKVKEISENETFKN